MDGLIGELGGLWEATYHLEGREVLLPPDVLLVLGSHGGNHIIEVHDNVDKGVEQAEESRVTAGCEADAEPNAHGHDAVMDHMEERDVLVLLAEHEEELRRNAPKSA